MNKNPQNHPHKAYQGSGYHSDFGSALRHDKDGGVRFEAAEKTKGGKVLAKRAAAAYPSSLHWYFKKGAITLAMLEAGRIFAHLYDNAALSHTPQSCLRDPIKIDTSRGTGIWGAEFAEDARRKVNKCYDILTPLEQEVIRDVAGMDERASGEKRVQALKTGLRALSVMFRIPVGTA